MDAIPLFQDNSLSLRRVRSAEASTLDLTTTKYLHDSLRRTTTTPTPYQNSSLVLNDTRSSSGSSNVPQICLNSELTAIFARMRYLLLDKAVYKAYAAAGFEPEKVKQILECQWPMIVIGEPDSDSSRVGEGWHIRKSGKENRIYIDSALINFFEIASPKEKDYLTFFLFAVVTHELAHYIGTIIFGLSYDTPDKIFGRRVRRGEAGECVEEAVFGGVIMANKDNQYKPVLVDEEDFFEDLAVERLVSRFWTAEMKVPFIGADDIVPPEDEEASRIKGKLARVHGYRRVMEIVRRLSRKRRGRKVTLAFTGPGKDKRDVVR